MTDNNQPSTLSAFAIPATLCAILHVIMSHLIKVQCEQKYCVNYYTLIKLTSQSGREKGCAPVITLVTVRYIMHMFVFPYTHLRRMFEEILQTEEQYVSHLEHICKVSYEMFVFVCVTITMMVKANIFASFMSAYFNTHVVTHVLSCTHMYYIIYPYVIHILLYTHMYFIIYPYNHIYPQLAYPYPWVYATVSVGFPSLISFPKCSSLNCLEIICVSILSLAYHSD